MEIQREIRGGMNAVIAQLYGQFPYSSGKAKLAKLRNTIGKTDLTEAYPFLFQMMPEELLGRGAYLSDEEKAMVWSLQLYALLQQGNDRCVHVKTERYENFGTSLARLREGGDSDAIDCRFNAMVLAETGEEFITHLRHLLRIFKSRDRLGTMDFGQLAVDIYQFIHRQEGKEAVRLRWSREFYQFHSKGEEKND